MMQNDWILDVLADLRTFASANGLEALVGQLENTTLIAAAEIASQEAEAKTGQHDNHCRLGPDSGGLGRHQRA